MQSILKKHKLLAVLLLAGVLAFLNLGTDNIRGTVSSLFSPLQSLLWRAGQAASSFTEGVFLGVELQQRVRELEAENLALSQEILSLKEAKKENDRFREAMGAASQGEFDMLFAEIIGKEIERDVLLVNKGTADGVKKGMPVITQSRVAAGSIGEAFEHTSKVLLLSLSDSSSDVKIQGKEMIGVLTGQGRYRARLDFIPQAQELLEGDVVVTSALGGVFPNNLLVGELRNIDKSDLAAFQGGEVELFFHPRKENSLFILTNEP